MEYTTTSSNTLPTSTVGNTVTYTYTTPLYDGSQITTTSPTVVHSNYIQQPPSAFAEKAKDRENAFLGKELVRSHKTVAQQERKEARSISKAQKHAERATQLVSKGSSTWRSSRHEEAVMKYQSQAQYHHNVATEAKQSIERAELMRGMPARGITSPTTITTVENTIPGRY